MLRFLLGALLGSALSVVYCRYPAYYGNVCASAQRHFTADEHDAEHAGEWRVSAARVAGFAKDAASLSWEAAQKVASGTDDANSDDQPRG